MGDVKAIKSVPELPAVIELTEHDALELRVYQAENKALQLQFAPLAEQARRLAAEQEATIARIAKAQGLPPQALRGYDLDIAARRFTRRAEPDPSAEAPPQP